MLDCLSIDVCRLGLEVEQKPQLKARIRNRNIDCVRLRLLFGLGYIRVIVNIEDAPNTVITEIIVPVTSSVLLGLSHQLDSARNHGLWTRRRGQFPTG